MKQIFTFSSFFVPISYYHNLMRYLRLSYGIIIQYTVVKSLVTPVFDYDL